MPDVAMPGANRVSYLDAAAKIISDFEGTRLLAYRCSAGVWTVGVGHTGRDVHEGLRITASDAVRLLYADMLEADKAVDDYVEVPLNENQRAALVSLIFNIGAGAFKNSTLARLLNRGDYVGAAAQFARWNKAGGVVLPGLARRRVAERKLFEA